MPYVIHTIERDHPNDPQHNRPSTELIIDSEEVEEAVINIMKDEGITPTTVYLMDDYTEEDIEIDVGDYLSYEEIATLEELYL